MQSACERVVMRENVSLTFNGAIRGPEKSIDPISAMEELAAIDRLTSHAAICVQCLCVHVLMHVYRRILVHCMHLMRP